MAEILVQVLLEAVHVPCFGLLKKRTQELELGRIVGFEAGHRGEAIGRVVFCGWRQVRFPEHRGYILYTPEQVLSAGSGTASP